jgi:hypothetical protein
VPHGNVHCVSGACLFECAPGFADCNEDLSDGCEADLESDAMNCGLCGMSCTGSSALPRVRAACVAGECSLGCDSGWADCNHDIVSGTGDGCEVDPLTDARHCGTCGNVCTAACTAGACAGATNPCGYFASEHQTPAAIDVASNGSTFVVAWSDLRLETLFVAALDERGRSLGASQRVATVESWWRFGIGYDGTDFVVVWEDERARELMAQRVDANARLRGEPSTVSELDPNGIQVANGQGEVLVAADGSGLWLESTAMGSAELPSALATVLAPVGSGSAAIGSTQLPPSPERFGESYTISWASFDASRTRTAGGVLSPTLVLGNPWSTALASTGSGAVVAAAAADRIGPSQIRIAAFGSDGRPVVGSSGDTAWSTLSLAESSLIFGLASDRDGAWLGTALTTDGHNAMRVTHLDAHGRPMGASVLAASPRAAFSRHQQWLRTIGVCCSSGSGAASAEGKTCTRSRVRS